MTSNSLYKHYAADCLRLAEREASPEAKTVMLNMALCWVRLAEQKQALTPAAANATDAMPDPVPARGKASAKTHAH